MFPRETQKGPLANLIGMQAPVSFNAPLQIWTVPRMQPEAACGFPQKGEHYFLSATLAPPRGSDEAKYPVRVRTIGLPLPVAVTLMVR